MSRKRAVIVGALIAVVAAAAAYAYWTAGGTGSGSASTGTNNPLTAVQTTTVSNMYPGDSPQALSGNFTNPNPGPTYVTSVTASIDTVTKATGVTGTCDSSDYTLANPVMNVGAEVPSGTAKGSWSGATIQFNNKAAVNQDACKGATVTLKYTIA